MRKIYNKIIQVVLFYCIMASHVFAVTHHRPATGFGRVAKNIMDPVNLFSNFINAACFLIGGTFLVATIVKYVEHKRSPLMVPISTVVFLFVAGSVLVLLPFAAVYLGY